LRMPDFIFTHDQRLLVPQPLRNRHKLVHARRILIVTPIRIPNNGYQLRMSHRLSDSDPDGSTECAVFVPGAALEGGVRNPV